MNHWSGIARRTRARKLYVRRGADLESRKDWAEYHAWLLAKLELFHKTFATRVWALDAS